MCPNPMNPTFMAAPLFSPVCGRPALSGRADPAEPDTDCEHDAPTDNDLDDGAGEFAPHEAIADESDRNELTHHHGVSELQRDAEIGSQERKGMEIGRASCREREEME